MKTTIWHCPYCGCVLAPSEEVILHAHVVLEDIEDTPEGVKETITQEQSVKYYCIGCGEEVEL